MQNTNIYKKKVRLETSIFGYIHQRLSTITIHALEIGIEMMMKMERTHSPFPFVFLFLIQRRDDRSFLPNSRWGFPNISHCVIFFLPFCRLIHFPGIVGIAAVGDPAIWSCDGW